MPSNKRIREIKMWDNFGWYQKEIPVLWYCPFEDAVNDQKILLRVATKPSITKNHFPCNVIC